MKKCTYKTILFLLPFIFSSCFYNPNKISHNELTAQLMLGQSTDITKDVFRSAPNKITGTRESSSAIWLYMYEYKRTHYVPSVSRTTTKYNILTETYTVETYTRPGYTYETPDFDAYMVEVFAKNRRITGVDFTARQMNFDTGSSEWHEKNSTLYALNRYTANDQLKELKDLEKTTPSCATSEMRLKGCLQAAKYDSIDVLAYYLAECKVPLDTQITTWVKGKGKHYYLSDSGCFILGKASVREVLTERNNKKVLKKLNKLGIL